MSQSQRANQKSGQRQRHEQRTQVTVSEDQVAFSTMLEKKGGDFESYIRGAVEENPALESEDIQREREERDPPDWDEVGAGKSNAQRGQGGPSNTDPEVLGPVVVDSESFHDALRRQLAELDLNETEEIIARQFLGSLDDEGYLDTTDDPVTEVFENIRAQYDDLRPSGQDVWEVLKRLQRNLEPAGTGARSLKECIRLQLLRLGEDTEYRQTALQAVDEAFEAFFREQDYSRVQEAIGTADPEDIRAARRLVRNRTEPNPRAMYRPEEVGTTDAREEALPVGKKFVTPQLAVRQKRGDFTVEYIGADPNLRVSSRCSGIAWSEAADGDGQDDRKGNSETGKKSSSERAKDALSQQRKREREFYQTSCRNAQWRVEALKERKRTMIKTMTAIVKRQRPFFETEDLEVLRPLTQQEVANRIGMDDSTVSRVAKDGYVQTEWGAYPISYFIPGSKTVDRMNGKKAPDVAVKKRMKLIIEEEDASAPLTDDELQRALRTHGNDPSRQYDLRRRTVSKYRRELGIPSSRERKQSQL